MHCTRAGRCSRLKSLPIGLLECPELKQLLVMHNELAALPENLGNLTKLEQLFVSFNQLKELPDSIGNCRSVSLLVT